MKLVYYHDPAGNFGDDLNSVLWNKILPCAVFERDDVALVGIGSILNRWSEQQDGIAGRRVFVLGSGAGYGALPKDLRNWQTLAVRGPLTAQLIKRPEAAATDGAVLLRLVPDIIPSSKIKDQIALIPHYKSAERGNWQAVAKHAGMMYVDTRWPVEKVLGALSRAKLVIAEAMHGAIVADVMRIPWIPIMVAPDALPFKWRDWAGSLGLKYRPIAVPESSSREALYHWNLRRQARRDGITVSASWHTVSEPERLIEDFRRRYADVLDDAKAFTSRAPKSRSRAQKVTQAALALMDPWLVEKAVRSVERISRSESYLSADTALNSRTDQMSDAVQKFIRLALA